MALIWLHMPLGRTKRRDQAALAQFAARLRIALPDHRVLVTQSNPNHGDPDSIAPPSERRAEIMTFLSAHRPCILVWLGGPLRPNLLAEAEAFNVPVYLLDGTSQGFAEYRRPLLGRLRAKSMLRRFSKLLVADEDCALVLKALGARPRDIEVTGPLEEAPLALPCNESERADLAQALATRPVWHAADLPREELALALKSHGEALRRAHRFLLVVTPAQEGIGAAMAEAAALSGFRTVTRSGTDEIDADVQVVIADLPGEIGLWYRLAPITYFGGTITGAPERNPYEAAALGSAVLHGPAVTRHSEEFARLGASGASAPFERADDLSNLLVTLSAPDKSASLAHCAWEVSSRGAEATDRAVALISQVVAR